MPENNNYIQTEQHPRPIPPGPHPGPHPVPPPMPNPCAMRDPFRNIGYIDNLAELKNYILRKLGAPIVCVELTDEQLYDVIGDCIRYFWKYADHGTHEDYLAFHLVPGMTHYKICQDLEQVVNFECSNWFGDINQLFTPAHNLMYNELMTMGGMRFSSTCWGGSSYGDVLGHWNACLTWLEEAKNEFSTTYQCRFIPEENALSIWPTPQKPQLGLLRVYKRERVLNIIQHPLFRKYVVASAGKVWADALRKYSLTIAGGGTINADSKYSSYADEVEKLEDRIFKENPSYEVFVG